MKSIGALDLDVPEMMVTFSDVETARKHPKNQFLAPQIFRARTATPLFPPCLHSARAQIRTKKMLTCMHLPPSIVAQALAFCQGLNMTSARSKHDFLQLKRPASALSEHRASGGARGSSDSLASTHPSASGGAHPAGETFTLAFADTGIVDRSLKNKLIADQRPPVCPDKLLSYVQEFSIDYLAEWTKVQTVPALLTSDIKALWKVHEHTDQQDVCLTNRRWATIHKLKRCTPFGNELHIVCVKTFRGKPSSDGLFLDAFQRQEILRELLRLILDAVVPTVVIGDIGQHAASILKLPSQYTAQCEFLQSRDQSLMFLHKKNPNLTVGVLDEALPDRCFFIQVTLINSGGEHPAKKRK